MNLRPYRSTEDYGTLSAWLFTRTGEIWTASGLPRIGYVVNDFPDDVAMGFLRMVEGQTGMIDALCTNPDKPGPVRNEAIDLLVGKLVITAKELGLLGLVCFTKDKNTLTRSKLFGFTESDQTIIGLRLGE